MNKEREQQAWLVNEQIFNVLNDYENYYDFIDVHGQFREFAKKVVIQRLIETKIEIEDGNRKPNLDGRNHIFKISAGAGKHS